MLANQCAIRCFSPDEFLAVLRRLLTDALVLTPLLLANPLRPGFLPSAKFSCSMLSPPPPSPPSPESPLLLLTMLIYWG